MKNFSADIKTSFDNIHTLYIQLADMLQDADSLMETKGYVCLDGNRIGTPISRNIKTPDYWLYPYISRSYFNEEIPSRIKALGVLFVDNNLKPIEPIFVFGIFEVSEKEENMPDYHWDTLHTGWFNIDNDSTFRKISKISNKSFNGIIQGLPLEAVENTKSLEKLIIEPLLAMKL